MANGIDPARLTEAQRDVMRQALTQYRRAMGTRLGRVISDRVRADAEWRSFVARELLELLGDS